MNPDFYDWLQERYKHKTISNYLRALRHLEREGVNLDSKDSFREWILKERNKGTLERTLNAYIKPYNSYISFLGIQRFKPFRNQKSIKRTRATMEDYEKLVSACRGYTAPRDRLMVEILFKAGLRYIEIVHLTVDDFNLEDDKIIVRAGKNEKYREVPLFPSVKDAFLKYLPFRQALIEKINKNTRSLMVTQYGKPVTDDGGHNIIDRISKRAGISFSPHRARRFYGRYLWENGLKPELIQQLLGHNSVGTTMIYIQPDAEDAFSEVRKYMKKLDFRRPQGKGLKETVGHNLDYMVCSDRDLDPGRRLERPKCLAGLHHRSRVQPTAHMLIFNFLNRTGQYLRISISDFISQKGAVASKILYDVPLFSCETYYVD